MDFVASTDGVTATALRVRITRCGSSARTKEWLLQTGNAARWINGKKVAWAGEASEYCIFGSYDDTRCDLLGIADTKESKTAHKRYPNGEKPDDYYNVVKNIFRTDK